MEGLMKRTKDKLIEHIKNLEIENERLTRERNAAVSALDRWKTIQCLKSDDPLDKMAVDCVKQVMKIVDKVRTQF
jgi:hypothetical protein